MEPALGQPNILTISPASNAVVSELSFITVQFDTGVAGIDQSDLLVNGAPATNLVFISSREYTFYFPQPLAGLVQVAWALNHGITDTTPQANPFAGGSWSYILDPTSGPKPTAVLSEFLADNQNGIKDDDGQRNDWLELLNPGLLDANLDGWFLTDTATNLTKWRIPAVALQAGGYVLIWCSGKDRTDLNFPLHTNFKLQKEAGGFLALVDPQTNVISTFIYPAQLEDISYGRVAADQNAVGYFTTPTPGAQNSTSGPGFLGEPVFSLASGIYADAALILTILNTNGVGTLRYTTNSTLPTNGSPVYAGPLTLTANSTIKARIFPPANTNLLPSAVVARNFILLDSTATNFTSRLPILVISTDGRSIPSDVPPGSPRVKGSLVVIDTVRGRSSLRGQSDVHELAEFEIFGQTSAGFAKQPHRIEIQDSLGNDLDKSLLGMPADADWRLRNPYNDKTLLNDFLGFELWEKMGHYSVRRRFVEVFRDTGGGRLTYPGDYYGVMVLAETIKVNKDRVDIPSLSPYATNLAVTDGGFIFKRDKDSTGDLSFNSPGSPGGSGNVAGAGIPLKLHEPKVQSMRKVPLTSGTSTYPGAGYTTSATNQMNYLINFLRTMERAMYTNTWLTQTGANHYSYYLDPVAFADQMLHVEYTKQIDGYRLSDYFNKGRDGRIGPGPVWDWNLAYGNADYLAGGQTNGWYYEAAGEQDHPWARRLITGSSSSTTSAGDPNFVQLVADRWAMFRTNILNATNTIREIDQLSDFLSEAAARDLYGKYRNGLIGVYTWPNPGGAADGRDVDYVHPTNYLGPIETIAPAGVTNSIIGQMKKWMLGRYLWIDSQFTKVPTFDTPGGLVSSGATAIVTPPPGATLYYTLDGADPRASGGTVIPGAFSNNGPVVITVTSNIHIVARAKAAGAWKGTFSGPNDISLYTTIPPLRITEIMYHPVNPPPGILTNADHFEYLEVKNISASPLHVGGFRLHGGVNFEFPDQILTNGESAVIVRDVAAFQSRYGTGPRILGSYANDNLANDGDHLVLQGNLGEPILNFSYDDDWYPATDGQGFSLQIVNDGAPTDTWGLKTSWRPSGVLGGTPSAPDPGPAGIATIYVNEALTHTDPLPGDAIELYNPTGTEVNLGGWFLTDDFGQPSKYRIPDNTMIPANGYLVFYQSNSFGSTNLLVTTNAFALSSRGDEVYVFSADLGGNLTGWAHGYSFGPQADGVTFGRYITSLDEDRFVTQSAPTLGAVNSGPQVGPIVISEIYYHPPDIRRPYVTIDNDRDEYIELQNTSDNDVPLYDILNPGNTWRLRDAVDFTFPPGAFVPARGFILVVGIDPAAFRAAGGVPMDTPVYGPWTGKLDNSTDSVELVRPDHPEPPGTSSAGLVSYIIVDKVEYQDTFPWPAGLPDGLGGSLSRINSAAYGDDPVNWNAGPRTPGAPFISGGTPPAIVTQPVNATGIEGQSATFTVNATGSALGYIWTFNGELIPSAPSLPTLTLSPLILDPSPDGGGPGAYACVVFNSAGSVQSSNATLMVRQLPRLTLQPTNRAVWIKPDVRAVNTPDGTNVTFTIAASSVEPPLRYQWRFKGTNIPGATNVSLLVTNVQVKDDGDYSCVVSDGVASVSSASAHLTPLIQPMIVQPPLGQTVVEGSDFGQSVEIIGHPPPFAYSWRRALPSGTIVSNYVNARSNFITVNSTAAGLILPSGVTSSNYEVRLIIQNEANFQPGVLIRFTNTVVADFDRDGIPDTVETALGLNANDATDGTGDLDGDGMSNQAEYAAGTDPANVASYLKITSITAGAGATLTFGAVSNKTYSIQYSGNLGSGVWARLVDVLARSSNRVETITDPIWTSNRAYRVVTPRQP